MTSDTTKLREALEYASTLVNQAGRAQVKAGYSWRTSTAKETKSVLSTSTR